MFSLPVWAVKRTALKPAGLKRDMPVWPIPVGRLRVLQPTFHTGLFFCWFGKMAGDFCGFAGDGIAAPGARLSLSHESL
jgi:hypothetical protein